MNRTDHKKNTAGFSLLELLVAIGLLMIVTVPILGMFVASTRLASASYKMTIASFAAQTRLEEFVGLTEDQLKEQKELKTDGMFRVSAGYEYPYKGFCELAEVTVTVYDTDYSDASGSGSVLCTQTGIVCIDPQDTGSEEDGDG